MLPLGKLGYLPAMHFILTLYGLKKYLANYFRYNNTYTGTITLGYGKTGDCPSYAFKSKLYPVHFHWHWACGGDLFFWKQTKFFKKPSPKNIALGAAVKVTTEFFFAVSSSLKAGMEYKSIGYLPMHPLWRSPFLI